MAVVAGAVGWLFGQKSVFLLVPVFGALACVAVLSIPAGAIDHRRARGGKSDDLPNQQAGVSALLKCKPLVVFSICVMLFHFANAPLLPLVGRKLASANPKVATAMMSFCIIAAQLVMLPIAVLSGRKADSWGRAIRAVLYTLSDNTEWLIAVQVLDGVGAGILGTLTPLIVADLMRGTGRYNLALGGVATIQGVGASLSGLAAGVSVDHLGYRVTFLLLAGAAAVALSVCLRLMRETRPEAPDDTHTSPEGRQPEAIEPGSALLARKIM